MTRSPCCIVTARDTLKDIVTGLDLGADDYMIKPFVLEELEARIRVLLRRNEGRAAPVITWGNIQLDPASHGFKRRNDKPVLLSAREFSVLHALMERPGAVLSRQHLEEKIYGWNEEVESNTIEYHISRDLQKNRARHHPQHSRRRLHVGEKGVTSIRRNLLLSLLIGLIGCTGIMIGVAYVDTAQELRELFTDNLRRMAIIVGEQTFPQGQLANGVSGEELEESYVIQIWNHGGDLARSSTPEVNLPLQPTEGFSALKIGDRKWQIYTMKAGQGGFVQIALPKEVVATMVGESVSRTLAPFIVLFAMLSIGAWYAVGRSLLPLVALSRAIAGWDADKMQPLSVANAPQEIRPVVGALNGLLLKLDKAMSMQRQFTADAAHELRTPLTALKLQLDLLTRAQSDKDRDEAIRRLSEGIERSIRLATQLLSASRSMAVKTASDFQAVELNEIIRSCMATFVVFASEKNIEITFQADMECPIKGDEESLRVLVNNLMDNAVRYTPANGKIGVRLFGENRRVVLEVSDTGPGIPASEKERIFRRFYRMPGTASTGSGLGLSIVENIAESHGAVVTVANGPLQKGTTFRVVFPFPA